MSTKNDVIRSDPRVQQSYLIIGAIVIIAAIAAGAAIFVSSSTSVVSSDAGRYANIPQSRTADGGFVLGNPDAPITVVEFADFLCPHCQAYSPTISRFIDEYVATGKAKFEYRMLPTGAGGELSFYAARLAQCSDIMKPGSFWQAHDILFELASASRFSAATARTFAERMGLDYAQLLTCTQDRNTNQVITDQRLAGQVGVQGTPAMLIRRADGQLVWPSGSPTRGAPSYQELELWVQFAR